MDQDKGSRSVFVGNIPFDATESELQQIFSEVGMVKSFRMVNDKETGKPKGFGFVEYYDVPTAQSAIRNLQNRELNGRPLKIDSASQSGLAGGNSMPSAQAQQGQMYQNRPNMPPAMSQQPGMSQPYQSYPGQPVFHGMHSSRPGFIPAAVPTPAVPAGMTKTIKEEGKYGDAVIPKEAPEAISKVVASLPPEQMFELMKEMKECVQNNPHEARNMLLQNPQLAYALLQAQVVMRIVDPDIAMKMLHRQASVQPLVQSSRPAQPRPAAAAPTSSTQSHPAMANMSGTDKEKAQLIMQVMNLTKEQIQMLPAEQRKSILELREQLQQSGQLSRD